jgi:quercetin dioxygenase-like cupin family protein
MQPALQCQPADHRTLWFFNTLVHLRVSAADGHDGMCVLEHHAPHGDSPPAHIHRDEDEVFHILDGEVTFQLAGRQLRLAKGDTIVAPRGIPHTYRVESTDGGRWLTMTCNQSFERFVRSVGRPAARDALPAPSPPPSPEQLDTLADLARDCGIEFVGPPLS